MSPDIVVFDGVCRLCSGWVRFLLRHDRSARYRFATMQSESGQRLLREHGIDPADPSSFLLLRDGRARTESDAVVAVVAGLGGAWKLAGVLRVLPRAVCDPAYRWIARNRYRIFGRRTTCLLPTSDQATRFLD